MEVLSANILSTVRLSMKGRGEVSKHGLKNFLKHIFPPSRSRFEKEIHRMRNELTSLSDNISIEDARVINELTSLSDKIGARVINERLEMDLKCMPRGDLSFCEFNLVAHCNLNCFGCDHFSPLAEPEFEDFEEAKRDFTRLSSLFYGRVGKITLVGGEPLLHPNLLEFLIMIRENFPLATVSILTNGLCLLNQPEKFWLTCKENNIVIELTKYPIPLKFKEMESRAAKYGVKYQYGDNTGIITKTSAHFKLDVNGLQDGRRSFLKCHRANTCITIKKGKLYTCNVVPTIQYFNKYFGKNLMELPADSIDIYKASSAEAILEFLARPIPFCRYCMVDKTEWSIPWHQSKRVIEEWT